MLKTQEKHRFVKNWVNMEKKIKIHICATARVQRQTWSMQDARQDMASRHKQAETHV